jgi:hypothetical protein
MVRVTRANSTIPITVDTKTRKLIDDLNNNRVIALGDQPRWPRRGKRADVPVDMSFEVTKMVIEAALTSKRLRFAKLRGTMLASGGAADHARHTEIVFLIARLLPRSNLLCLNIGEWGHASNPSYKAVTNSLRYTKIGNLYWNKPSSAADLYFSDAQGYLKNNRKKDFFKHESTRAENRSFSEIGCQAWWDLQRPFYQRVDTELQDTGRTARCKTKCRLMRCHGLNKSELRCCLCTRHPSRYCHHHRKNL